jgi:N-acetylglucosaminyldiphosphoundecaprenol N-acetyl-beta-D-mannosaminyltransferase
VGVSGAADRVSAPGVIAGTRGRILNGEFDRLSLPQTVDAVIEHVRAGRRGWLCTVNVAMLMMMQQDRALQSFVDRATIVVADGQPLLWVARQFGTELPARVTGVDLLYAIARRAGREGLSIGLVGARSAVIEETARRLGAMYPNTRFSYVGDGWFPPERAAERAEQIRAAGTNILFVGMGVPQQERFIEQQWSRLGVNLAIGVGGSFEVVAGIRTRAPTVLQRGGLEWAFRLAQEPRRLWRRYLLTNSRFVYCIARHRLAAFAETTLGRRA